ncbi:MAG TPA: DUF6650 family protein [Ktedonobacteraceae bacterium]|nr:DUF6650 family protein [Ktedonobacteraceae bacterium]
MKPKLLFQEIASKITGFSTPVFGIQWEPPRKEREIAKSVVTFLEDRRVLYNPTELELPQHCISSAVEIRHFLTEKMNELDQNCELAKNLRVMRAACRKFLDSAQQLEVRHFSHGSYQSWVFYSSLGEMRGVFGMCLSQILLSYGLDIEKGLASILPASYKD